jgi:hypothetical protein
MMESPPQGWFPWILSGFVALLTGVFEYYRRKVDKIESAYVTRDDFKEYVRITREDEQRRHTDNTARLDKIDGGLERVHQRIDQVFQK